MNEKVQDEITLLNLLEQKRKILEQHVENEKANYYQDEILSISEEMDDLVLCYYRQKTNKNNKDTDNKDTDNKD